MDKDIVKAQEEIKKVEVYSTYLTTVFTENPYYKESNL